MVSQQVNEQFAIELSPNVLIFISTAFFINIIIQITFKILVCRLIYKKGPLKDNPINVMILADELQKIPAFIIVQPQMVMVLYEKNIGTKYGQAGCLFLHVFVFASVHTVCSSFICGFAIACLR